MNEACDLRWRVNWRPLWPWRAVWEVLLDGATIRKGWCYGPRARERAQEKALGFVYEWAQFTAGVRTEERA